MSGEEMAGGGAVIGMLDLVVIGGVVAVVAYYFVRKRKQEAVPEMKKLTVISPLQRRESYDPSFVNKMKKHGRNVVVFYGSQTGTGEEFAGRLAKDAARYGMKGMVADPEECEMEDLCKLTEIDNSLAIFCMATYGEGDPTDNAQEFFEWLQEGSVDLSGITFAVFGLGNKTYEHYNKMGIYVDKRLEELGAQRVIECGLGDDDGNIEEDFLNWREQFWPAVCTHFGVEATGEDINTREYELKIPEEVNPERVFTGEPARLRSFKTQKPPFDAKNPYLAPIQVNRELHKGGDRSCLHIEFNIEGSKLRYEAGDHVAVYPVNDATIVDAIGARLKVDLDQVFSLVNLDEDASKKHPFPCPTTYRTALAHYLDITNCPRTNVLKELSEYATDQKDKDFLLKMVSSNSAEAKELYSNWVLRDHRNILAILEDLPSVMIPMDHLCEILPRLQPRYYSISSSPKQNPTSIHITAVVVEYKTRTGRMQYGVATNWLKLKMPTNGLQPTVPIYVRKSQFRLPFKPSVPVIMIGPGTGLAPFRGFIQDRHCVKDGGKQIGDMTLFFGCRHEAEDFIYRDEIDDYKAQGTLTHVHTAFSRDGPEKIYVQHLIANKADETWQMLEAGAHIYVCGDARGMAPDVDQALQTIVKEKGNMDSNAAQEYLKRMRSRGRYSCDVWS